MARLLVVLFLVVATAAGTQAQAVTFPEGIAAGDVTHESGVVWTRAPGADALSFEYADNLGFVGAYRAGAGRSSADRDFTVQGELRGLRAGQRYYYRPVAGRTLGPVGTFVTPPAPDGDEPLSLVWGADTNESHRPFRIFEGMRSRAPDAFLFLGDTIYADLGRVRATTLDEYRQKYRTNREGPHLRSVLASTTTWVIWDDHEVENNFSSEHGRLHIGLRAFQEYWPIRPAPDHPSRLYRSVRWGRTAELFILDARQYRSPSRAPDGPDKTMLGQAQKQWLLEDSAGRRRP